MVLANYIFSLSHGNLHVAGKTRAKKWQVESLSDAFSVVSLLYTTYMITLGR